MPRLRNFLMLAALLSPVFAHAQTAPEPVQYVVSPETPGPYQTVTIEAQGIGSFLGDAAITWSRDGKVVQAGTGLRTYSFITDGIGSATRIHIDIKSATNGSFSKDLVFRPSSVNLVWEADTTVPPLYAGKALYSAGSTIRVAAFPTVVINGAGVSSQSLSYQWSRGGESLPQQSGLGRNTLSVEGDQLQSGEGIAVGVYFGSSLVARSSVAIPAEAPHMLLYERDALRGVLYDAALPQAINLTAKEITIAAQPYYFARQASAGGSLQYAWTLDGNDITGPDSARGLLTLRQTGSGSGSATLAARLQNNAPSQLVQSAETLLQIIFGQGSGGSLFGL